MKKKILILISAVLMVLNFTSCMTSLFIFNVASMQKNFEKEVKEADEKEASMKESFIKEAGDYPKVLVYGTVYSCYSFINITFIQSDSAKPVSRISGVQKFRSNERAACKVYYSGIALADCNYKVADINYVVSSRNYTTYYWEPCTLNVDKNFDFRTPKDMSIYYVGAKDYLGNDVKLSNETVDRINVLKQMKKIYEGTDWEPVIDDEIMMLSGK